MTKMQALAVRAPQLLPLLCAGALIASGAGSARAAGSAASIPDTLLAVYDGGSVSPSEFARAWAALSPPERPPGDALKARQIFLESVVHRKLLAREAARHAHALTPAESTEVARNYNAMLQNQLFAALTKDVPEPSDADIDRFLRQRTMLAEVRVISFADRQRARSWRSRLATGTPMSALDAAIALEGAALGTADSARFVAAEQLPDTLAQVIWSLRPGQLSEIQEFGGETTMLYLRSYMERPGQQAIQNASNLKAEYIRKLHDRIRERFRSQLVEECGRTFDDAGVRFLLEAHLRLPPRNDVDTLTGVPTMRPNLPLPGIAPADTSRIVARLRGRSVSIGDYLAYWGRTQPYARPDIRETLTLEAAIDRVALGPELVRVARERGLDRDDRMVDEHERLLEGYALDHYYRDEIESRVRVTDAALRKLFAAEPGHYDDRASITSHIIVLDRRTLADSLLTRLRAGESFHELARTYSMDGESAAKGGDMGLQYFGMQPNAGLQDAMFATPAGRLGGPEQTPQGWVIWRIDSATPGQKRTFEQARPMLERDFRVLEADRILTARLEKIQKAAHVRMFPERLTTQLGADGPWGD
ncbi:MAG: peptidylprolyl isomerase [Candidatus Eisenbacteria bacterium]